MGRALAFKMIEKAVCVLVWSLLLSFDINKSQICP